MTSLRSRQQNCSEVTARRDKLKIGLTKVPEPTHRIVNTASRNGDKRSQLVGLNYMLLRYSWIGIVLVIIWLGGLYYVCQSTGVKSSKLVEIQHLLRRGNAANGRVGGNAIRNQIDRSSSTITFRHENDLGVAGGGSGGGPEIIDMRQLTRTLPFANPHEGR